MDNYKLIILILNMVLHSKFICNKKSYNYDSPNSPPNYAFTLNCKHIVKLSTTKHLK